MPIEIRELVIKVKVEEPVNKPGEIPDMERLKIFIETTCKQEVRAQLIKLKER